MPHLAVAACALSLGFHAHPSPPSMHFPEISKIFGVRQGYDTIKMIEKQLGASRRTTGGHPRGRCNWYDSKHKAFISTDGFDYRNSGGRILEDGIMVEFGDPQPNFKLPNPTKASWGVFEKLRPGMSLDEVRNAMKPLVGAWKGWEFSQKGFAQFGSNSGWVTIDKWTVRFESDEKDRLTGFTVVSNNYTRFKG